MSWNNLTWLLLLRKWSHFFEGDDFITVLFVISGVNVVYPRNYFKKFILGDQWSTFDIPTIFVLSGWYFSVFIRISHLFWSIFPQLFWVYIVFFHPYFIILILIYNWPPNYYSHRYFWICWILMNITKKIWFFTHLTM